MIVTSTSQPASAKATIINSGKGAVFGSTYQGFKEVARIYGFYKDIKPYLPETYLDKYRYKPHKRVAGYAGQIFWSKTKFQSRYAPCNKFNQKYPFCER